MSSILVPSCGVLWGIGANPLAGESYAQAVTNFETTQGRAADVLHFYHVGARVFPSASDIALSDAQGKSRLLMENWKPELGHSWAEVAAGVPAVDREIDNEATYLKTVYTKPFFLSVHHEPEDEVIARPGSGYTAADYAAMYRHVVLRLSADGVTNAIYVMDYMGYFKWGLQPWFDDLYPGDDVVDWIGYNPYTSAKGTFAGLVNSPKGSWPGFYSWASTGHAGKPLMLAEWGVTESTDPGAKANFFRAMTVDEQQFPAIKALLYWNDAAYPTRIDSSPQSLAAYQRLTRNSMNHGH